MRGLTYRLGRVVLGLAVLAGANEIVPASGWAQEELIVPQGPPCP